MSTKTPTVSFVRRRSFVRSSSETLPLSEAARVAEMAVCPFHTVVLPAIRIGREALAGQGCFWGILKEIHWWLKSGFQMWLIMIVKSGFKEVSAKKVLIYGKEVYNQREKSGIRERSFSFRIRIQYLQNLQISRLTSEILFLYNHLLSTCHFISWRSTIAQWNPFIPPFVPKYPISKLRTKPAS